MTDSDTFNARLQEQAKAECRLCVCGHSAGAHGPDSLDGACRCRYCPCEAFEEAETE